MNDLQSYAYEIAIENRKRAEQLTKETNLQIKEYIEQNKEG